MNKKLIILYISCISVLAFGFAAYKKDTTGVSIGEKATDIILKDPTGKELKLSTLKGKVVLLDFWASWCGPCRRENPALVSAYQKYKDKKFTNGKGFTIYSVSLDRDEKKWNEAIVKDGLVWKYHVLDKANNATSPSGIYKVEYIPTNFLIDGTGTIVAKNLRGATLEEELEKLIKK